MTTDTTDATVTLDWIAMMGYESQIEATIRNRRVLVDAETRDRMAQDIIDCGLASDEEDAAYAADIRNAPAVGDLFDVTTFGGDMFYDQLVDFHGITVDRYDA